MTQVANQEEMWQMLFEEERARLMVAAEIISSRKESTDSIIHTALEGLKGLPFYKPFGLASALRSVVKAAIAYNLTVTGREDASPSLAAANDDDVGLSLMVLPWPERTVYFLREVLVYSRRDTALLLSISDTNVDQLKSLAKRRLQVIAQRSFKLPPYTFSAPGDAEATISRA
jgi:hypothetical protein